MASSHVESSRVTSSQVTSSQVKSSQVKSSQANSARTDESSSPLPTSGAMSPLNQIQPTSFAGRHSHTIHTNERARSQRRGGGGSALRVGIQSQVKSHQASSSPSQVTPSKRLELLTWLDLAWLELATDGGSSRHPAARGAMPRAARRVMSWRWGCSQTPMRPRSSACGPQVPGQQSAAPSGC